MTLAHWIDYKLHFRHQYSKIATETIVYRKRPDLPMLHTWLCGGIARIAYTVAKSYVAFSRLCQLL